MQQDETEIFLFVILSVIIVALCSVAFYLNIARPFTEDRRYIKTEMERAYNEKEYRYWKQKLKKLYISQIPFIGRRIVEYMR